MLIHSQCDVHTQSVQCSYTVSTMFIHSQCNVHRVLFQWLYANRAGWSGWYSLVAKTLQHNDNGVELPESGFKQQRTSLTSNSRQNNCALCFTKKKHLCWKKSLATITLHFTVTCGHVCHAGEMSLHYFDRRKTETVSSLSPKGQRPISDALKSDGGQNLLRFDWSNTLHFHNRDVKIKMNETTGWFVPTSFSACLSVCLSLVDPQWGTANIGLFVKYFNRELLSLNKKRLLAWSLFSAVIELFSW